METSDNVSLALRLALLESLTLGEYQQHNRGSATTIKSPPTLPQSNQTILIRSHNAQTEFLQSIDKYKPIVQFVNDYKDNKAFLQPMNLKTTIKGDVNGEIGKVVDDESNIGGQGQESDEDVVSHKESFNSLLSTQSIISLLLESEQDLRQLDRDLRSCESHHERNTAGTGKLAGELSRSTVTNLLAY